MSTDTPTVLSLFMDRNALISVEHKIVGLDRAGMSLYGSNVREICALAP